MARRNNSRKRSTDLKTLIEVIFIIIDAGTLGTIFVFIGHDAGGPLECTSANMLCKHDTTSLGTWVNMPSATTELMGNTTYRSIIVPASTTSSLPSGVLVSLTVNCITVSNTSGANLELQDAVFDLTSETNVTNFVRISTGIIVFIDGGISGNLNDCPSNNSIANSQFASSLTGAAAGQGYVLRVVGTGGGGTGDNPRFGSVVVDIYSSFVRIYQGRTSASSTTGFTAVVQTNVQTVATTAVTYNWFATNVTTTNCGSGDHCFESGTGSCTIASNAPSCVQIKTFTTAFSVAPTVIVDPETAFSTVQFPLGALNLLLAQTLTV